MEKKDRKFLEKDGTKAVSWSVNSDSYGLEGSFCIGEHTGLYFYTMSGKPVDLSTAYKVQDMLEDFVVAYAKQADELKSKFTKVKVETAKKTKSADEGFFGDLFMQRADAKSKSESKRFDAQKKPKKPNMSIMKG